MRRLLLAFAVVTVAGCHGPTPYLPDEERPRVAREARWWEEQGDHELERAKDAPSLRKKEEHYAIAVGDFRTARDLYYEELEYLENAPSTDVEKMRPYPGIKYAAGGPVPAGRREALEIEIERLSAEIKQLIAERPIDPPPEATVTRRVFPLR
jgi:hypothetical protein